MGMSLKSKTTLMTSNSRKYDDDDDDDDKPLLKIKSITIYSTFLTEIQVFLKI